MSTEMSKHVRDAALKLHRWSGEGDEYVPQSWMDVIQQAIDADRADEFSKCTELVQPFLGHWEPRRDDEEWFVPIVAVLVNLLKVRKTDMDALTALSEEIKKQLTLKDQRIAELEAQWHVPGCWYCKKCGFVQFRNILHAQNGAISADTTVADMACPNDGELMHPVDWRDRAKDIASVCEQQIQRATDAEQRNKEMEEILDSLPHFNHPKDIIEAHCPACRWQKLKAQ